MSRSTSLALLLGCLTVGTGVLLFLGTFLALLPEPIHSRADIFAEGARVTVLLSVLSGGMGLALGTLAAAARLSRVALVKWTARIYIEIFRGTPLMTQILFIYFALPALSPLFKFSDFIAAAIALSLNVGAYNAEAVRAGILSVPCAQTDAAFCLGLTSWQTTRYVVFPQAWRIALPPLLSNFIALIKDSAMASVIGLAELTLIGNRVTSETFHPVPTLFTVAAVYLFLTGISSSIATVLESRSQLEGAR